MIFASTNHFFYSSGFNFFSRSDPTSGHIMRGMKGLLPSSLPPLTTRPSDLGMYTKWLKAIIFVIIVGYFHAIYCRFPHNQ